MCQVLRCAQSATEVFEVRREPLVIDVGVCRDHHLRLEGGDEWLWVRDPDSDIDASSGRTMPRILMDADLRGHNEWVVEKIGSVVEGNELSNDGEKWVLTLHARQRGRLDAEPLRLSVDIDTLRALMSGDFPL